MSKTDVLTKEKEKNIKNIFCTKNIIWLITIILMLIPIYIAFFGKSEIYTAMKQTGALFWKREKEVVKVANNPFTVGSLAGLFGCVFYSIICLRCRNEVLIYTENKIDIKNVILHIVNLIFTTTLFMLIPSNAILFGINLRALMIATILFSFLCIKSLAGYLWIFIVVCMLPQLTKFDDWRVHGYIYVMCAYLSLVSQIIILKVFKFDLNAIMIDIGFVGNSIKGDINASIEATKNVAENVKKTVKKIYL